MLNKALILTTQRVFAGTLRSLIQDRLAPGSHVDVETDPFRAMQLAPAQYQLVVMDVQLGMMDGLQLLLMMRPQGPQTQFVVVADQPSEMYRFQAYQNGASLFLDRPGDPNSWQKIEDELRQLINPAEVKRPTASPQANSSVSLGDLVQTECLSGNSTLLEVTRGHTTGDIFISNGAVYHAQIPGASGLKAFMQIMHWPAEEIAVKTHKLSTNPPRTIEIEWAPLLKQARERPPKALETSEIPEVFASIAGAALEAANAGAPRERVLAEAPPLSDTAALRYQSGRIPLEETAPDTQSLGLVSLAASWRLNLMGEMIESWQVPEPEPVAAMTFFVYNKLSEVAVDLEVEYFQRLTLYGSQTVHELVADNLGIDHGLFWLTETHATDREKYATWCYAKRV